MYDLIEAAGLLLAVSSWLCNNLHFVSGERPHCRGDSLAEHNFSKNDEVGLVRDLLVDVLARNLFNRLDYPVPSVCEDLARTRTSTCIGKCFKWKRDGCWSGSATRNIMAKAEALVEHLNTVVSSKISLKNIKDEEIITNLIEYVKTQLVQTGAADEDSKILGQLDTMKNKFCKNYVHEESIRKKKIEKLLQHEDVKNAIEQFITEFQTQHKIKVSNYFLETDLVEESDNMESRIIRLNLESAHNKIIKLYSTLLKIPSLSYWPFDALKRTNMFDREVHFYTTVLQELYRIMECEPFAPKFFMATSTGVLALQDLIEKEYKPGDRMKQLNYLEAEATLNVLATYHAAGYKYLKTLDKGDPSMSLIGSDQPALMAWINRRKKATFDNFIQLIKSSSKNESLLERILRLQNQILADPVIKENSLIVILHADCQPSNILFKYDDKGDLSDVKLIDWQSSRIGNPIVDLIYFFVTSVYIDVYEINDEKLLNYYIDTLCDKLKLDQSEKNALHDDLYNDLDNYKYYFMNVISTYWQEIMSVGASTDSSQLYITRAEKWLHFLEKKSYI